MLNALWWRCGSCWFRRGRTLKPNSSCCTSERPAIKASCWPSCSARTRERKRWQVYDLIRRFLAPGVADKIPNACRKALLDGMKTSLAALSYCLEEGVPSPIQGRSGESNRRLTATVCAFVLLQERMSWRASIRRAGLSCVFGDPSGLVIPPHFLVPPRKTLSSLERCSSVSPFLSPYTFPFVLLLVFSVPSVARDEAPCTVAKNRTLSQRQPCYCGSFPGSSPESEEAASCLPAGRKLSRLARADDS